MSEEHDCQLCKLSKEVFGHENCSQLTNDMAVQALDAMNANINGLRAKLQAKFDNGEVSKENFELLQKHLTFSLGYSATTIACAMCIEGPRFSPPELLSLISEKIKNMISSLIAQKLGTPAGNVDIIPMNAEVRGIIETFKSFGINVEVIDGPSDGTLFTKVNKETDPKLN